MTRTREQVAAYQRAWRARHPERARWNRARWRAKHRLREKIKRTQARGRVCRACDGTDEGRAWSMAVDLCAACAARGRRNGFCPSCGQARYGRPLYAGLVLWRCACGPGRAASRAAQALLGVTRREATWLLALRDALVAGDVTRRALAEAGGTCDRTVERQAGRVAELVRLFEPAARWEDGKLVLDAVRAAAWLEARVVTLATAAWLERKEGVT